MLVRDLMNDDPATITPSAGLDEALALMAGRKHRHLMVLNDAGDLVGVVSDQDMAMVYDPDDMTATRWQEITVGEVMTRHPVSIGSGAPVKEAAKILLKFAVTALPVVDNGQLVGVLSDRDFTRHFAQ